MKHDKDWIKLDNAATIYPATIKRKYAALFRLTITLNEDIDRDILSESLIYILKRFPTFTYSLKEGFFWCYLEKIKTNPKIENDSNNPMIRRDFDKKYLFRVRTYKNRIAIEYFHALTDGTGGMTFMLSLVSEYLHRKYKMKKEYTNLILNIEDEPSDDECNDAFLKYANHKGALEHEKKAFHLKGTKINDNMINIITGILDINQIKKIAKKNNATITEYITSVLLLNLQELSNNTKKEIKISIPINLRNLYDTKTLRNFSSYVNVGITNEKNYTLKEVISIVKNQLKEKTKEEVINAKITGNVNLMKNYFIRRIPMFIKKHIMSYIESVMGDGYITTTLSNLGNIELPTNMKKYITDMNFILGKSRGKSTAITMIGYNNKLYITFSRNIEESEFERLFFTTLSKEGIDVLIESNR